MNFPKLDATMAILTWRSPKTLQRTLQSLEPLTTFFNERIVVCQEADPEEISIAEAYGYRVHVTKQNLGIQNGLKKAVQLSQYEQVLLLENDTSLETSMHPSELYQLFFDMYQCLSEGALSCVRLRYVTSAFPIKIKQLWKVSDEGPRRRWLGWLRYAIADSVYAELGYYVDCQKLATSKVRLIKPYLLKTDSRYLKWMNSGLFLNKTFFLETIINRAEEKPTNRMVNGMPELEHPINSLWRRRWWIRQRFDLGLSVPPVFGHVRLDRSVDDEKKSLHGA